MRAHVVLGLEALSVAPPSAAQHFSATGP